MNLSFKVEADSVLTALANFDILWRVWKIDGWVENRLPRSIRLVVNPLKAFKLLECNRFIVRHVREVVPLLAWMELERTLDGIHQKGRETDDWTWNVIFEADGIRIAKSQGIMLAWSLHLDGPPEAHISKTGAILSLVLLEKGLLMIPFTGQIVLTICELVNAPTEILVHAVCVKFGTLTLTSGEHLRWMHNIIDLPVLWRRKQLTSD